MNNENAPLAKLVDATDFEEKVIKPVMVQIQNLRVKIRFSYESVSSSLTGSTKN